MKNDRTRLGRYITLGAVTVAVVAQTLVAAMPAHAQTQGAQSPAYFDRNAVMQRAKTWTDKGVPYSQTGWLKNYRTDCSGFVSMAWNLDRSYVTWSLPEVAKPISKADLQPGDILLQQNHVIMFGGWTNSQHTAYTVYEEVGGPMHKAVKRVVPYPYDSNPGAYKPYRFTGGHNLSSPGNTQKTAFMATNAGGGQVAAPNDKAAQMNARIQSDTLTRGRQVVKQQAQAKAKADAAKRPARDASASKATADAKRHDAAPKGAVQPREAGTQPFAAQILGGLLGWLSK